MKKQLLFLFFIVSCLFHGSAVQNCFGQCISYDVHACIDVVDLLHVQGNQMWWVHQGGSNPGQHSSCSGDVLSVNGASWGNWSTPYTLSGVTTCMDMTSNVTQCSNICALVQSPSGSNGWETIYKFDDSGPSAAHNYKINFTFCPTSTIPTLTFTVSSPACAGNPITFTYTGSASPTSTYSWNFGDGSPLSTVQSPSHSYVNPGSYNVSLDVTNECNIHAGPTVVAIPVSAPPTSTFNAPDSACIGVNSIITYTGSGLPADTYTWSFSGGTVVSGTGQGPYTVNWATAGTKIITLSVDQNGCVSPLKTDSVIVNPVPIATFTPPAGQCKKGNSFSFTAGGNFIPSSTFLWTFGTNATPATSTQQNPTGIVFSGLGYQTVTMTFVKNGCVSNTFTDSVKVYTMPVANFSFTDICLQQPMNFNDSSSVPGDTISGWSWNFADSSPLSSTQNSIHTFLSAGTFPVSLVATTNKGCKDTVIKSVTVHPLPDAKFSTANVCDGAAVPFNSLSTIAAPDVIQSWTWNFADSSPVNNNQTTTHLYAATGSYAVQLLTVSDFGCRDSVTKTSIVKPNPVVKFSVNDSLGCAPLCISFTDMSTITTGYTNVHWEWNFGDGSPMAVSQDFEHCYVNASISTVARFTVSLTVTTDSGCVTTGTKNNYISVYPNPKADFTVEPNAASYTDPVITITDLSTGTTHWHWDFGNSDTSSLAAPAPHTYADTGSYMITLITSTTYGCQDTTYQTITIEPDFVFYVPSAFSPDGDHLNDTFSGKGLFISQYSMTIFDRWGNLIFFSDDINLPWDGKVSHGTELAQRDVYVYSFKLVDIKKKKHNYTGVVTLLR